MTMSSTITNDMCGMDISNCREYFLLNVRALIWVREAVQILHHLTLSHVSTRALRKSGSSIVQGVQLQRAIQWNSKAGRKTGALYEHRQPQSLLFCFLLEAPRKTYLNGSSVMLTTWHGCRKAMLVLMITNFQDYANCMKPLVMQKM